MAHIRPLAEQAADALVHYIMTNHFSTSKKLPNEYELSQLLGVGRSTVREAVKLLVSRNVLEVRHGAGTFVCARRIGISDDPLGLTFIKDKKKLLLDLMEVRMMIEPRIASLAAMYATPEDIAKLKQVCSELEALTEKEENYTQKDVEFHEKIAESSNNLVVLNLLPIIQEAIILFSHITNAELAQETVETHQAIVQAIAGHNPVAAADAMTLHIIHKRNHLHWMVEKGDVELNQSQGKN